jgi:tetratricopeptide (TPR) repeat protein
MTALSVRSRSIDGFDFVTRQQLLSHIDHCLRNLEQYIITDDQRCTYGGFTGGYISTFATFLGSHDREKEAEQLFLRVEDFYRNRLCTTDTVLLRNQNNLGTLYLGLHRLEDAERVLLHTLDLKIKMLGPDHHLTLNTLLNIGNLRMAQGQSEKAWRTYAVCVSAYKQYGNAMDIAVLKARNNLGELSMKKGDFDLAERIFRSLMRDIDESNGDDIPAGFALYVKANLALVLKIQEEYQESIRLYNEVIEGRRVVFGPEHSATLAALDELSKVLTVFSNTDSQLSTLIKTGTKTSYCQLDSTAPYADESSKAETRMNEGGPQTTWPDTRGEDDLFIHEDLRLSDYARDRTGSHHFHRMRPNSRNRDFPRSAQNVRDHYPRIRSGSFGDLPISCSFRPDAEHIMDEIVASRSGTIMNNRALNSSILINYAPTKEMLAKIFQQRAEAENTPIGAADDHEEQNNESPYKSSSGDEIDDIVARRHTIPAVSIWQQRPSQARAFTEELKNNSLTHPSSSDKIRDTVDKTPSRTGAVHHHRMRAGSVEDLLIRLKSGTDTANTGGPMGEVVASQSGIIINNRASDTSSSDEIRDAVDEVLSRTGPMYHHWMRPELWVAREVQAIAATETAAVDDDEWNNDSPTNPSSSENLDYFVARRHGCSKQGRHIGRRRAPLAGAATVEPGAVNDRKNDSPANPSSSDETHDAVDERGGYPHCQEQ